MKIFVVILTLCVASCVTVGAPQYGPCVEMCGRHLFLRNVGDDACGPGYECRSNGCGHTCQPVSGSWNQPICKPQPCGLVCRNGRKVVNGCTLCQCNREE